MSNIFKINCFWIPRLEKSGIRETGSGNPFSHPCFSYMVFTRALNSGPLLSQCKGIVNLFSCDSEKLGLILKFTKTSFLICLNLSQHHISLKTFHIFSFSCTGFLSILKYLFEQNLLC